MKAITLPAIRGKYNGKAHYSATLTLEQVMEMVKPTDTQESKETAADAPQPLTLAVSGGDPKWNEMCIEYQQSEYHTMGLFTLSGGETITAVSGHRTLAEIRRAMEQDPTRGDESVAVVFVGK